MMDWMICVLICNIEILEHSCSAVMYVTRLKDNNKIIWLQTTEYNYLIKYKIINDFIKLTTIYSLAIQICILIIYTYNQYKI